MTGRKSDVPMGGKNMKYIVSIINLTKANNSFSELCRKKEIKEHGYNDRGDFYISRLSPLRCYKGDG